MKIFKKSPFKKRGSALVAVVVVCTCVAVVAGSAIELSTNSRRMNHVAAMNIEARNAAEAIVEFGMSDLTFRFDTQNSFTSNELSSTKKPLTLPSSFHTIFANGNVVMPPDPYVGAKAGTYSTEIIGGNIGSPQTTFIDSRVPGNETDVLANRSVIIRQVNVYGKATVEDAAGRTNTAYCRKSLQIRDAPLFSYAIFYNMDLEIAPGANMTITGPVHTNGNLYVAPSPATSATSFSESSPWLKFAAEVSAVGGIYHSFPDGYNDTGVSKSADFKTGRGYVYFTNSDGDYVNMCVNNKWITSDYSDWYKTSLTMWEGNVKDAAYSVQTAASVGFSDYVADDPLTSADELQDYAYQMIMPLVNKNVTTATSTSPAYNEATETQKYEFKAGLVIKVHTDATNGITGFALYAQSFDPTTGDLLYTGNSPKQTLITDVTSVTSALADSVVNTNFFGSSTATATGTTTIYASQTSSSNNSNTSATTYNSVGNTSKTSGIFRVSNYKYSSSNVTSGMYDGRRLHGVDILEIDMNHLRVALETANAKQWRTGLASTTDATYNPKSWWNGIIYVEFDYDSSDTVGSDNVRKAVDGYGVRLVNAKSKISGTTYTPGIPYPTWATSVTGTTVATNNVIYVLGSYNADGSSTTGSATALDTFSTGGAVDEPAASLVADSITILSDNWRDYNSMLAKASRVSSTFIEVSAAFITGLVPTNKYNADHTSGGVHNLLRFLEIWSNITVRYRGSIVCLYESEVSNEYFTTNYYGAPTRDWGFNTLFANGTYPPGTPLLRTYNSVDCKFLTEDEWAAETSVLP